MKIMMVHVRYRLKGGEDAVFENEIKLLRANSSKVSVVKLEYTNDQIVEQGILNKLQLGLDTIWSRRSYKLLLSEIKEHDPDIVHFHNIFPLLSPSVYKACNDAGVPVVQTLHNYRWICPAGTFYRDGNVCEECVDRNLLQSVKYACYRESSLATSVVAGMILYSRINSIIQKHVSRVIVLTEFAKEKFVQSGLSEERIVVKPNFCFNSGEKNNNVGEYVLFIGRISKEKGIYTLMHAMEGMQNIKLKVAGDGPELSSIRRRVKENNINVEMLGSLDKAQLNRAIKDAAFIVLPSQWYEGFPMVVLDAYSNSKPILVSKIGGLSELVDIGVTGNTVEPCNPGLLQTAMLEMLSDKRKLSEMGRYAYEKYEREYSEMVNFEMLYDIYDDVIN